MLLASNWIDYLAKALVDLFRDDSFEMKCLIDFVGM